MAFDARSTARHLVVPILASALALAGTACGAHRGAGLPNVPTGPVAATKATPPDGAQEGAKTVTVEVAFERGATTRGFDKTFADAFEKKGLKIDETLTARAHFDVKEAKITGTVTYVRTGAGTYSIVEADLVTSGHYDADLQVDLDVQVRGDAKTAKVGDWDRMLMGGKALPLAKNVMPTDIPVAGPLSLQAHFDISAACDMDLEGPTHATTGVGIAGDVRIGAKYRKAGFEPSSPDGKRAQFQFDAKTPGFELAPRPYLDVKGGKQRVKGRCSLQPTVVLVIDDAVGAKLSVEPFVALEATRATAREKWSLDAQAGVSVHASTDIDVLGRQARKPKEFALLDMPLTKPGDEMGVAPASAVAAIAPVKAGKVQLASVLGEGLGLAGSALSPASPKPRGMRGLLAKKKKM